MKCNNCSTENDNNSNFCINCGNKLEKEKINSEKFCSNCGNKKNENDRFCVNCGTKFETEKDSIKIVQVQSKQTRKKKHQPHKKYVQEKNFDLLTELKKHKFITAAAIVILGYIFFQVIPKDPDYTISNNPIRQTQTNLPLYGDINSTFNQVASKFICSCGTCGELSLETCGCPSAKQEHNYINSLLSQNNTIDQTVIAVANKYGWLKSQYYPQYQVDKSKVWFGNVSQPTSNNISSANLIGTPSSSLIATIADRSAIISQFECPCGQCNIKELAQCTCNHLNGAIEVKGFIDQKILDRNKTVEQIITEVSNKYGGRKI